MALVFRRIVFSILLPKELRIKRRSRNLILEEMPHLHIIIMYLIIISIIIQTQPLPLHLHLSLLYIALIIADPNHPDIWLEISNFLQKPQKKDPQHQKLKEILHQMQSIVYNQIIFFMRIWILTCLKIRMPMLNLIHLNSHWARIVLKEVDFIFHLNQDIYQLSSKVSNKIMPI